VSDLENSLRAATTCFRATSSTSTVAANRTLTTRLPPSTPARFHASKEASGATIRLATRNLKTIEDLIQAPPYCPIGRSHRKHEPRRSCPTTLPALAASKLRGREDARASGLRLISSFGRNNA